MEDPNHLRPSQPDQPVILVADDETIVCNVVRIGLEAAGFFVLTASDGEQALLLSRKFPGAIHGLVSDVKMPNLDGLALREQILRERPGIKVLLMSGQVDAPVAGVPFLPKPFKLDEMKLRVRQLVLGVEKSA
jgi:DNA-binding NtrC family response regulator